MCIQRSGMGGGGLGRLAPQLLERLEVAFPKEQCRESAFSSTHSGNPGRSPLQLHQGTD